MTKFDFREQLQVGQQGEQDFLEHYPEELTIHPGYDGDFILPCGGKLELKTDTYSMAKTSNFFIERWSDFHRKKPGFVWQAREHGCTRLCYYFVRDSTYFEFRDLEALQKRLEELTEGMSYIMVKNKGWLTVGYKVPRAALEDLYEEWEIQEGES